MPINIKTINPIPLKKKKNNRIGLAVSGGIDSMVLLDIFNKLSSKINLKLYVLHFNHKWRKEAKEDVKIVSSFCKRNNLYFLYSEEKGTPIKTEEEARKKRYDFFNDCIVKHDLDYICTAHHLDDQVETILFRLCRGTGPLGLMPIKAFLESTSGRFIRPLLNTSKEEIIQYAKKYKIKFAIDKTNFDTRYKRNLLREKVIPQLLKINKSAKENIIACSEIITHQQQILDKYFSNLLIRLSNKNDIPQENIISRSKFLKLDISMKKALIYWLFTKLNLEGGLKKIDTVITLIKEEGVLDLSKSISLLVSDKKISFKQKQSTKTNEVNKTNSFKILISKKENKIQIKNKKVLIVRPFKEKSFKRKFKNDKELYAYVNLSSYHDKELTIRNRKQGDTFKPLGFPHTIKLKKFLINKKVPVEQRYNTPLLCYKNEILWIPGYSLSDKIKVLSKPTHILKLVEREEA